MIVRPMAYSVSGSASSFLGGRKDPSLRLTVNIVVGIFSVALIVSSSALLRIRSTTGTALAQILFAVFRTSSSVTVQPFLPS